MRRRSLPLLALSLVGCLLVKQRSVKPITDLHTHDSVHVKSPARAHLNDGSTIRFPNGFTLTRGVLRGTGTRYDLRLKDTGPMDSIQLDSVIGVESYVRKFNPGLSLLASAGTSVPLFFGVAALAVASSSSNGLFGSCPTFYSDSGGSFRLEAEGFSYSISTLFESRDVDRLSVAPDASGTVRVEVRNEAYETHYLNHLELLEVRHRPDELVLPDPDGRPLAVRATAAPLRATGRGGQDLRATLAKGDGLQTRTDPGVLAAASEHDLDDSLAVTLPVPERAESVAVTFRLRNSLLNTVLLYDVMLGDRGARSLDWLGRTVREVGPALQLGQWYAGSMGLRILVVEGDSTREVARLRDTGPLAWKDVRVLLSAPQGRTLHLRLVSVADNWRIDQVALGVGRHLSPIVHSMAELIGADALPDSSARAAMAAPDDRYLQTTPSQRFTAVWRLGGLPTVEARTVLLASQGYYIEWIRRGWLAAPRDTLPFRPGRAALVEAVSRWRVAQDSMEARFFRTRVPVR